MRRRHRCRRAGHRCLCCFCCPSVRIQATSDFVAVYGRALLSIFSRTLGRGKINIFLTLLPQREANRKAARRWLRPPSLRRVCAGARARQRGTKGNGGAGGLGEKKQAKSCRPGEGLLLFHTRTAAAGYSLIAPVRAGPFRSGRPAARHRSSGFVWLLGWLAAASLLLPLPIRALHTLSGAVADGLLVYQTRTVQYTYRRLSRNVALAREEKNLSLLVDSKQQLV